MHLHCHGTYILTPLVCSNFFATQEARVDDIQMRLPGSSSQSDLSLPKSNINLQRWKELRGNLCQRCTQDLKSFNLTEHTSNQHIQKTNQPVNPPQQTRLRGRLRQLKHFMPCLINRFTCGCGSKKIDQFGPKDLVTSYSNLAQHPQ